MKEFADRDFNMEVLNCHIPILACFVTRWCHSCYSMCLLIHKLVKEYEGKVKFVKVNIKEIPNISAGHRVIAVPTILIYKHSQLVKTLIGFQDRTSLRALLDSIAT